MKDLLLYLVKSLVDNPDAVQVNQSSAQERIILEIQVDPQDMGKIIGKGGKIIKSLRNIVKIMAIKEGTRVDVEILETSIPVAP